MHLYVSMKIVLKQNKRQSSNTTTQFIWTLLSDNQIFLEGHTSIGTQWGTTVNWCLYLGNITLNDGSA